MTAALLHHPLASLFPLLDGDEFDAGQERASGAGHGQALFYFGENASKFRNVFGRKGEIVLPWREDVLAQIGGSP